MDVDLVETMALESNGHRRRRTRRRAVPASTPRKGVVAGAALLSFQGEGLELEIAAVWKREGDLYWIRCPKCDQPMYSRFSRFDAPREHRHRSGQCNANMIVVASAATGVHQVELVDGGEIDQKLGSYLRTRKALHQHHASAFLMTDEDG